ncbi:hypothetical protein ACWGR4_29030 [Embleya sp. NPDC055664]
MRISIELSNRGRRSGFRAHSGVLGVNWLGVYVTMADRFGWTIEHPILDPDGFGRRVLACFSSDRVEALAGRLRVGGCRGETDLGLDPDMLSAVRSVRLELEWAQPRIKDPHLAIAAKEGLELIRRIAALID